MKNDITKKQVLTAWCNNNNSFDVYSEEVERITSVFPTQHQLDLMEMGYYSFIHFGINTMNGKEWGNGNEDISIFNPQKLDTDQWCKVLKDTGSKGIIITAKHHDGFCLFDTRHTDHNVMNTPYKKDIVKMLSESCKKYSMKLGIYLSPWDRHEKTYGTEKYNDYFVAQLTELCENYGDIFVFWFDGACGEGKNGKKQIYDWDRYYSVIRKLQPGAIIANCGPDVRWIGNEGGRVRESEWSVIPLTDKDNEKIMENSQKKANEGKKMVHIKETTEDLGSRAVLKNYDSLIFKPAEADVSINLGWFYHGKLYYLFKKNRTAEDLAKIYFNTVGGNATMLLNVPPNKSGLIDNREIKTLKKFTELIKEPFKNPITDFTLTAFTDKGYERTVESEKIKDGYMLDNDEIGLRVSFEKRKSIKNLILKENLAKSQRVEQFKVYSRLRSDENYTMIYSGTVIGYKKFVMLKKAVQTDEIIIAITQSRANPILKEIEIFE